MSESESEDEILDRIEAALRKIAAVAGAVAPAAQPVEGDGLDRVALIEKLDGMITRLRDGLGALPAREAAPVPAPEGLENFQSEPGE